MPGPAARRAERIEHLDRLGAHLRRFGHQHHRIEVALDRAAIAHPFAGAREVHGPVDADRVAADAGDVLEPESAALGEDDDRHADLVRADDAPGRIEERLVALARQRREHAPHRSERELLVGAVGERPAPRIEDHQGLRAGLDLGVQVGGHRVGIDLEDAREQVGAAIEHRLDLAEVGAAAALDHVAGERPGAAREADQRHAAGEHGANGAHGVGHVAQLRRRIGRRQPHHGSLVAHRPLEARPFALGEVQPQAHGVGHGEDVGEQDRRIEREALERLQRHLARQLGRLAQGEEAPGARARGVVLGQVAPGLAHQPDRRVRGGLAPQRAQESVVGEGRVHPAILPARPRRFSRRRSSPPAAMAVREAAAACGRRLRNEVLRRAASRRSCSPGCGCSPTPWA